MNIFEHNRKVAISRWSKVQEREKIDTSSGGRYWKAALYGFLAGDGCVRIRTDGGHPAYTIACYPDDKLMLDTLIKAFEYVYQKTPHISQQGPMFAAKFTSKTIFEDLTQETKFGLNHWRIPFTFLKTVELKRAWLKAFFSAESYVSAKVIRVQTVNEEGMRDLAVLMRHLGLVFREYRYVPKNRNYNKVFIIIVTNKASRQKYFDEVGFWHARKMLKLQQALAL